MDELSAEQNVAALGAIEDTEIDLAEAALAIGVLDYPSVDLTSYRAHLNTLVADVRRSRSSKTGLDGRIQRINRVLFETHGYAGDAESYDDPQNANLIRVIDRHLGLPVILGVLYIHVARAQRWEADGLAFPGHFLVRLEIEGRRAIIDPFHAGQVLQAGDLRNMLKQFMGTDAELLPEHYATVSNRNILLRAMNNIKTRAIDGSDIERAAVILDRMTILAPEVPGPWRELGMLEARRGNMSRAIRAIQTYANYATTDDDREAAARMIKKLKTELN